MKIPARYMLWEYSALNSSRRISFISSMGNSFRALALSEAGLIFKEFKANGAVPLAYCYRSSAARRYLEPWP